jgi:hypothetical protein
MGVQFTVLQLTGLGAAAITECEPPGTGEEGTKKKRLWASEAFLNRL